VFDSEHLTHLWKRHPCNLTVWKPLTDWLKQVTMRCDLCQLLCSHSNIVCLLIQSNYTELQPSVNTWIWVALLFDQPVEELTSHFRGASGSTVHNIRTEFQTSHGLRTAGKKCQHKQSVDKYYTPLRTAAKRKVHGFLLEIIYPQRTKCYSVWTQTVTHLTLVYPNTTDHRHISFLFSEIFRCEYAERLKSHTTHYTLFDGCSSVQVDLINKYTISLWLHNSPDRSCHVTCLHQSMSFNQPGFQRSKCSDVFFKRAVTVHCWTLPGISFLLHLPKRV
jgi:hypothetical protein